MQATAKQKSGNSFGKFLTNNIIIIGIGILAIVVSLLRSNFLSFNNIRNLLGNTAIRFIIAVGVSGCLITRGTDLSAGRVAGFAACIAAIFLQKGSYVNRVLPGTTEYPVILVLLIVVGICAIIGAINGSVVAFFKVPPFIATLGMQTLVYGLALVLTGAQPIGSLRPEYTALSTTTLSSDFGINIQIAVLVLLVGWLVFNLIRSRKAQTVGGETLVQDHSFVGRNNIRLIVGIGFLLVIAQMLSLGWLNDLVSFLALIALAVGLLMWTLYNKMRYGKYMYAIGGNESAAEVAGVNVNRSKVLIYTVAACMYGLCGFLLAAKAGGASVNTAMGYELEAIAGCTIGGVSVNGGVGKISGILIGVLVFEVLKIAMQFMGLKSDYTYIVQGLVIIIAVALDLRKYLAKK